MYMAMKTGMWHNNSTSLLHFEEFLIHQGLNVQHQQVVSLQHSMKCQVSETALDSITVASYVLQ